MTIKQVEKGNSGQYKLIAGSVVLGAELNAAGVGGDKFELSQIPAGSFLEKVTVNNVAWTGTAATALIELLDATDETQVEELVAAQSLTAGGRSETDLTAKEKTAVATILAISAATLTGVTDTTDVEVYLEFWVEDRANESLE